MCFIALSLVCAVLMVMFVSPCDRDSLEQRKFRKMDRKLLKTDFNKENIPAWSCPACGSGILHPKKNSFLYFETAQSKKYSNHPDWEPEWDEYTYSMVLECSNKTCSETVANVGTGKVEMAYEYVDQIPEAVFEDTFRPKYFYPPLILFKFPETVADDVKNELIQSFEVFFCNPPSAANHIRIALERLLNHLKVKRFEIKSKKKRYISLHQRIEIASKNYPNLREYFLALKWLGNAGSHSDQIISIDDVIDSYEIFEFVLNELFKNKSLRLLVKQINKMKGPKHKKA